MLEFLNEKINHLQRKEPIITVCGDDCSVCPRYIAESDKELLEVAKLWYKLGWRDKVVSTKEIKCTGCKVTNKCRYKILSCTIENNVKRCTECSKYPCNKITEMFKQSGIMESQCKKLFSDEEFKLFKRAFYEKKENIEK